ncbi:hypothetical protein BFP70_00595 [Thioclava sp. SK-1]|uniref:imelysin family protein n=1 Tax=Thioclava sp. SK-1 TaxID=1889770 RepID=UPI00082623DB|nr:imelysin family protein [Thioclava sp. SK-1]OCX66694.1 hypothetical protein BFP70_00595 [Thioclava sp. SK-1]
MRYAARLPLCLLPLVLGLPAQADVPEVIHKQIEPGYAAFADATVDLARTAQEDCTVAAMRAPWDAAFDAWLGVQHVRLGPVEENGRALAISFWPDPKAIGRRQLRTLLSGHDPQFLTPEGISAGSVAVRGLFALDTLLHGDMADDGTYACDLRRAIATDLADMAGDISAAWVDGFDQMLLAPGTGGNTLYLDSSEARQALFTQLVSGLEFNATARLGRPLGTFDHPRPERAELIETGRSLHNLRLSMQALHAYAQSLAQGLGAIPDTEAAFARSFDLIDDFDDPVFASVADPMARLRVEIIQQQIQAIVENVEVELGAVLGVTTGFNAADGD